MHTMMTCDSLLEIFKKKAVRWFGHVVRDKDNLASTLLPDNVEITMKASSNTVAARIK